MMRRNTQDATSESVLQPIALNNPSSAPVTHEASIPHAQAALTNLVARITHDTALPEKLGWCQFVAQLCSRGDFASLDKVDHPAQRLLKLYKELGALVKMANKPSSRDQMRAILDWGTHQSCMEHTYFLYKEFHTIMMWLTYQVSASSLQGLYHSKTGVQTGSATTPRQR